MEYKIDKKVKIAYINIQNYKYNRVIEKIKYLYRFYFNKVNVRDAGSNKVFEIPLYKKNRIKKNLDSIINKLKFELDKENIEAIVLSKQLKQILCDKLKEENIGVPILNGKFLMKNLVINIIEKILKIRNENINLTNIYVLVDKYNKENLDILYDLASKVKYINIITNNIKYFKKMEDRLLKNDGVAISVANNRKKSLKRAEIIINFDFNDELIRKYNINREAIIVNCYSQNLDLEPFFSGVIINNIEIEDSKIFEYFEIYDIFEGFVISELYESLIFTEKYDRIVMENSKANLLIKTFLGNRGYINPRELTNNTKVNVK